MTAMEDTLKARLQQRAEDYAALTGLSLVTVQKKAFNDSKFLRRIAKGGRFTVTTYDTAMRWFDENWPVEPAE